MRIKEICLSERSKIESFKYSVIFIRVTMKNLKTEQMLKVFGKVEIETMMKKINGRKLKQTERNYLYRSIRPKLIAAEIISQERILEKINKPKKGNAFLIEYNLSLYGYELISLRRKRAIKIGLEELIIQILVKYPEVRYIEAIPILIVKNKIDKFKLLEFASNYSIKNKIGYLLETALMLKNKTELKDLLRYLKRNKDGEVSFLIEGDKEFLLKTSPKRVKEWNLLGRFFDEDFRRLYDNER